MPILDLDPAAREVAHLLDGVTDDKLAGPTPCTDTTVSALLDHLMGLSLDFTWAPARPPGLKLPTTGRSRSPTAEHLDPNWRNRLPERLNELADAWRARWPGRR